MRVAQAALLLALHGGAFAFTNSPITTPFGLRNGVRPVFMSDVTQDADPASSKPSIEPSGLSMAKVRQLIASLTVDNFSSNLSTVEPFLLNEAGATIYAKSMKRIAQKAKELGVQVPEGYAKEAKAIAKRREKQDAFIQTKEEERLAAKAEAAEAGEAEEAATTEAQTTEEAQAAEEEAAREPEPVEA